MPEAKRHGAEADPPGIREALWAGAARCGAAWRGAVIEQLRLAAHRGDARRVPRGSVATIGLLARCAGPIVERADRGAGNAELERACGERRPRPSWRSSPRRERVWLST